MKNMDQNEEGLIRKYINPGSLEKAPEGFTLKAVTRIQIEAETSRPLFKAIRMKTIPIVSILIIFFLVMASVFIPDKENGFFGSAIWDKIQNVEFSLPQFSLVVFPDLPGWLIYSIMGIILLVLFDFTMGAFSNESKH